MKAALIPPKGYEHTALESDIHLVLPLPPLRKNMAYIATYAAARLRGDYIILDNGCAEDQLVTGEVLMQFAKRIGAHEIVAPDVMSNAAATLEATNTFLDAFPEAADYNIMAVLQGVTQNERSFLLDQFAKTEAITAIGIPKVLSSKYHSKVRLDTVEYILNKYPGRFQIHLLGLNSHFPNEIAITPFKGVRSMDSAQPYKLAEVGASMNTSNAWATRRIGYFTDKKEVDPRVLAGNIQIFKQWAAQHES
jgi:queuine/archaeosine tRNA-ribosyltransferase